MWIYVLQFGFKGSITFITKDPCSAPPPAEAAEKKVT